MIFYFSATGNSRWVAEELARQLDDRAVDLVSFVKNNTVPDMSGDERLGIVFPIHAWGPPEIVLRFAKGLAPGPETHVFAAATCGSETGYAFEVLDEVLPLHASYSVRMPNNYIISHDVNPPALVREKLGRAPAVIARMAQGVKARRREIIASRGGFSPAQSRACYENFLKRLDDGPFFAENRCVGCGVCAGVCPLNNIRLADGKPAWQGQCMQCMACISHCPTRAIQYGQYTQKKGRYLFSPELLP